MKTEYIAGARRRFFVHVVATLEGKPLRFCQTKGQALGWIEQLNRAQAHVEEPQRYSLESIEISTGKAPLCQFANDLISGVWFGEEHQLPLRDLTDAEIARDFA